MTILKWLAFLPLGIFNGLLIGGLIFKAGNYLLGGWTIPSIIFIWFGTIFCSAIYIWTGFAIVPNKNKIAKWVLITPLLVIGLFQLLGFILWTFSIESVFGANILSYNQSLFQLTISIFGSIFPKYNFGEEGLSQSLSAYWEFVIFNWMFFGVALLSAKTTPERLAEGELDSD